MGGNQQAFIHHPSICRFCRYHKDVGQAAICRERFAIHTFDEPLYAGKYFKAIQFRDSRSIMMNTGEISIDRCPAAAKTYVTANWFRETRLELWSLANYSLFAITSNLKINVATKQCGSQSTMIELLVPKPIRLQD